MRFRLRLFAVDFPAVLPLNYHYPLSAVIYKILQRGEEAYLLSCLLEKAEGEELLRHRLLQKLHALYDFIALVQLEGHSALEHVAILRKATITDQKQVILRAYRSSHSHPSAIHYVQQKGNNYLLDIPVADYQGIGRFVLGSPGDISDIEPTAFHEFLRKKIKKSERVTEVVSGGI